MIRAFAIATLVVVSVASYATPSLAAPIATTVTIALDPSSPVADGTLVTITGNVVASGSTGTSTVSDGTMQIQQCPGASTTGCVTLDSGAPDANGDFSTVFDTTGYSDPLNVDGNGFFGPTLYFAAHFVNAGSGYATNFSPVMSLTVTSACEGLLIGNEAASGNGTPAPGEAGSWSFTIEVHNCTGADLAQVKVQGGTVAWISDASYAVSQGSAAWKGTKKNPKQVLVWSAGPLADGASATATLTITGTVPRGTPCGSQLPISGAWSATGTDADGNVYQSTHTDRAYLTVICP